MPLTFSQSEIDALESDTQRIGIFFRMETDPTSRLWLGIGDIKAGINALDGDSETYLGFGQLVDVPALQQLINGVAERVSFHVSGVSADTLRMASTESDDVQGALVSVGICLFGAAWQQLGVPTWISEHYADFVTLSQQSDAKSTTRVIELSVGSRFTGRRRRGLSFLSNQDQLARHPGDLFCARTSLLSQFEKVWPTF